MSFANFGGSGPILVVRSGQTLGVRVPWDSTYDLVHRCALPSTGQANSNDAFNLGLVVLIPKGTSIMGTISAAVSLTICGGTDQAAPDNYCNGYIDANHGMGLVKQATITAHGLVSPTNLGSIWSDGTRNWTVVSIIDANTVLMCPPNANNPATNAAWNFVSATIGASLTYVSGPNSGITALTVASSSSSEWLPCVRVLSRTIRLDGKIEMTDNGYGRCSSLHVSFDRVVVDQGQRLALMQSNPGRVWTGLEPDMRDHQTTNLTYIFQANGAVVMPWTHTVNQKVTFNSSSGSYFSGCVQSVAPTRPSGGSTYFYIPGCIVGGFTVTNPYDFSKAGGQLVSTVPAQVNLTPARCADSNNLPARFSSYTKTSGGAYNAGIYLGYVPDVGLGVAATRKTWSNGSAVGCFILSTALKMYPNVFCYNSTQASTSPNTANNINATQSWAGVSFYTPLDPQSTATVRVARYEWGGASYVMVDVDGAYSGNISLGGLFVGRAVTAFENSGYGTVGATVTASGLNLVSAGQATGVFKLQ